VFKVKSILRRKVDLLPQRPEPFVFRLEINPEASWTRSALNQMLEFSTIVQLEAVESPGDGLLQIVQDLDRHPQEIKIRLVLPSAQINYSSSLSSYVRSLSRLKKSTTVMFLASISQALNTSLRAQLLAILGAFSSAGVKTGLLLELAPTELASLSTPQFLALEDLVTLAVKAGALEVALRPLLPSTTHSRPIPPDKASEHETTAATVLSASISAGFLSWVNELKARGLVLSFEECFPLGSAAPDSRPTPGLTTDLNLSPNLTLNNFPNGFIPNCRQAFGSCFIDRQGLLKPCRLSENIIGDLKQKPLKDIFSSFIFSDRHYCLLESARLWSAQPEPASGSSAPSSPSAPSAPFAASTASTLSAPFSPSTPYGSSAPQPLSSPYSSSAPSAPSLPSPQLASSFASAFSSSLHLLTPVRLDSSLRPVPLFQLLHRNWGGTLVHGYDSLVLSPRGARLAGSIDGRHNLRWFKKKFGAKALSFICGLFLKGYIRLEE